jgi:hypothetical protein
VIVNPEKPQKNETGKPRKPPKDVAGKLDPEYKERDFDDALNRTTRRLDPSEPDRGSTRK